MGHSRSCFGQCFTFPPTAPEPVSSSGCRLHRDIGLKRGAFLTHNRAFTAFWTGNDMADTRVHAFGDDALGDHDGVALAQQVRRGEVSAQELADAAIARAERVNGILNAVRTPDYEQARNAAREPTYGPFTGVPTFIKDNTDVAGLPTCHGSAAIRAKPAARHGAFARQYLAQGFTLLGKSTLPEFGFNASTEFCAGIEPTRNPWNPAYSSGASSGGSAALVAAGVVPVAHANDGGGSIRIPAACCGLVGLKPTRGRLVNPELAKGLPVNVVVEGVVTRTVRDTAHFFAGAERYWRNPRLPALGLVEGAGSRPLRIALMVDSITGQPTCPETREVVLRVARILEGMGHRVEEAPLDVPYSFIEDFSTYWGMLGFMLSRFGTRLFGPDFDASRLDGLSVGLADYYRSRLWKTPAVVWRLKRLAKRYSEFFRAHDLVLSPVLAHTTPQLGHLSPDVEFDELFERLRNYVSFTPINNVSGGPAISLPGGRSREGLPIGIQLSANHGEERMLLEIAYALEEANPWPMIHQVQEPARDAVAQAAG